MFTSVPYVIQFVVDPKRSLAFYTEVLGLALKANYDDMWIELEGGNTVVALHGGQKHPAVPTGEAAYCKFSFGVASVSAAAQHLARHGVTLAYEPREVGPGMFEASFHDPDGIQIGMYGPK